MHENSRLFTFVHLQGNVRHRLQGTTSARATLIPGSLLALPPLSLVQFPSD